MALFLKPSTKSILILENIVVRKKNCKKLRHFECETYVDYHVNREPTYSISYHDIVQLELHSIAEELDEVFVDYCDDVRARRVLLFQLYTRIGMSGNV
ncbi:hypothetical protein GCK72_001683 [Caenorhabditis remanei]|uniref:Uncharacterized protein n=1 Tax=Caenorhabditis remanei TaxID=31234 RepID=A0A6A5HSZ8_CAERE|nr:hypothetical protein GCK72_001683 [Caenorhabditis remanei]KAF1769866.1 hypothetical protein GCK72_001683 [Caenorhabditis remanei]